MFGNLKRIFAFVLVLAMAIACLPAGIAQAAEHDTARKLTEADYTEVDMVFDQIETAQSVHEAKKAPQSQITDATIQIVLESDSYVANSLDRRGDAFTWWTDSGIRCIYSPRFEKLSENFVPENSIDRIINEPATKGGKPAAREVYLVGPYYGIDATFTDQYRSEASRIARAIGDTDGYTVYSGRVATIDKVAEAVSNGAVVLFDSHGATDYENGFDHVTGASNSYLCLNNASGLTDADFAAGAAYGGDGTAFVNGQTIANHMTKNSPGGICWFAICLGMATDTLCTPLRNKGVEVVYGYSQSVTFDGEYLFSGTFWQTFLKRGTTVAQAISAMKNKWGQWDTSEQIANYYGWLYGCTSLTMARDSNRSFPVVVSDEDPYPGQRSSSSWGADSPQNVRSTYTLGSLPGNGSGNAIEPTIPIDPSDGSGYDRVRFWVETEGTMVGGWPAMVLTEDTQEARNTWMIQSTDRGLLLYYSYFNFDFDVDCADKFVSILLPKNDPSFYITANFNYYKRGGLKIDQLNYTGTFDRASHRKGDSYTAPASDNGIISADEASRMLTENVNNLLDIWDAQIFNTHGFGMDYLGFVNYNMPKPTVAGDFSGDGLLSNDDVIMLMWHVVFPDENPVSGNADLTGDGKITNDDVIVLMWHILFPEENPLN